MPGFADFAGFAGVVEKNTIKHKASFIICMNCAVMNLCLYSVLYLSSYNTDVETTDQFVQLHTRHVCDFSC